MRRPLLFGGLAAVAALPLVDSALGLEAPWHLPLFCALFVLVLALAVPPAGLSVRQWLRDIARHISGGPEARP